MSELREALPRLTHPDGAPVRVLVADAESMVGDLLSMGFSLCGWEAQLAHDGAAAVQMGTQRRPDLAVLDTDLPESDGLEVMARLRAHWPELPVLILSAQAEPQDRIAGLAAGADDFVAKPFALEEVLLRAHRLVQRSGMTAAAGEELVVGDLVMNTRTHEVRRGGDLIELTATQFNLLKFLMANVRTVLSKERILQDVWGYDFGGRANIVELYISYLRKRVDAGREPMIHTVRGAGYVIRPAV
ncbi:response regulator transcription factor [Micrococcus sp.]|uniref:response regulator transcription factor n=1 Tax=Micrococcus sp. TaxID=1271 RepID=UPI002A90DF4C|nr:response regulator transcription factor [Micrococcus sp.]MDY6055045.1 response regulator transcription factor [Micrococcus sp.]